MNLSVLHSHPLCCQSLQSSEETCKIICNHRVMLYVVVSVKIACELLFAAIKQVIHVSSHKLFICFCFTKPPSKCRSIYHIVSARVWFLSFRLKVIPVLHHFSILK